MAEAAIAPTMIRLALDLGLLTNSDGVLSFAKPELRQDYLVRHAVGLARTSWNDREAFAITLSDVQHRSWRLAMGRRLGAGVLRVLANEDHKDIVGLLAETAVQQGRTESRNNLFWNLYALFCEALPDLAISSSVLAEGLDEVLRGVENDLAGVEIYGAVERLAARSPEVADDLSQAFVAHPESPVAGLAVNALCGLASFHFEEAHRRALLLIDRPEPVLRRVGITALGRFAYYAGRHDALLAATIARFEQVLASSGFETTPALVRAYGNLLQYTTAATTALVALAAQPEIVVQAQVAFVLSQHADEAHDAEWYKQALFNVARIPSVAKDAFANIDHAAATVAGDDPAVALAFAEAVVVSRKYGIQEDDIDLSEVLERTFIELYNKHPAALAVAITHWLAVDDPRLHRAAHDIINRREQEDLDGRAEPLTLSKEVLDALAEERVVYVLRRILGYIRASRPLTALLLSALHRNPCSTDLQAFITAVLGEYVLYNFPGEVSAYLKSRLESGKATPREIDVIKEALSWSEAYFAARRDLPVLTELRPPSHRVYLLRLAQQKQQAAMMEESTKQSGILSLVHRAPLKHGRAFFFERDGSYTDPSPLSRFEHGMELPQGDFIDPVGQIHQRLLWRSAGLATEDVPLPNKSDQDD